MNQERWHEIKPLLDQALDLEPDRRAVFIEDQCDGDPELLRELEAYLRFEDEVPSLFEEPIVDLIAGLPPEYRAGQQIGPFELEEEIARGGMGVVYRGRRVDGGFEQMVAIKILKRGFDTGDFVRRFRNEQKVLARLQHRNIARLFDGGATPDGLPFLVMELVDGVRLDEYCRTQRPSLPQRLAIFSKLCLAVHVAHQHMVVHCDLKPSNILIETDGEPKLLDFGIAKVLQDDPATTYSMGTRMGTPPFASPEQVDGRTITTSSDIFALGAILFFLVTGRPPRATRATDPSRRPSRLLSRLPVAERPVALQVVRGDLDAIVEKAMAFEPDQRYGSVEALDDDIARHLANRPVAARTRSTLGTVLLFLRRRRKQLIPAAIITAILAISAANSLWLTFRAQFEAARSNAMRAAYLEMIEVIDPTADESPANAARTAVERLVASEPFNHAPDQAVLYDRVGRVFFRHNALDQASVLLERALALRENDPETEPGLVAASLNNLALVNMKLGELETAAGQYARALALYRAHPEGSQARLLDVLHNLAGAERDLAHWRRAESLYVEALDLRKAHFGVDSKEAARTMLNLGNLLLRQHRLTEAEPLLDEAAAIREAQYGSRHYRVAVHLISQAHLRDAQGRIDESIALYRRALQLRVESLGPKSSAAARARSALAFALLVRGTEDTLQEARQLLEPAVAALSRHYGPTAEPTLVAQRNLAALYLEIGELPAAEQLLRDIDLHASTRQPAQAWRIADTRNLLGTVLAARGQTSEGLDWLAGTCEALETQLGVESRYARDACSRSRRWGNPAVESDLER